MPRSPAHSSHSSHASSRSASHASSRAPSRSSSHGASHPSPPSSRSSRSHSHPPLSSPPRSLMAALMLCLTALLLWWLNLPGGQGPVQAAGPSPSPSVEVTATPSPAPTPMPTPSPTSEPTPTPTPTPVAPDYSQSVPAGDAADADAWFQDAVFIGDSRTDGFHLYSGVKGGTYLVHTGLTVFEVIGHEPVLGTGENKYSVLSALGNKQYGKVYIALGVNELGWFDADAYSEAMGKLVDKIRALQPDAVLYIQAIVPVNSEVCKSKGQPYYVTNENISNYNEALAQLCEEKEVWLVNIAEALVDPETGELPADMTHDGVHFKKAGYQAWLEYLLCHTGQPQEEPGEASLPSQEPVPTRGSSPAPSPEI